jgi:hypothetical protein
MDLSVREWKKIEMRNEGGNITVPIILTTRIAEKNRCIKTSSIKLKQRLIIKVDK